MHATEMLQTHPSKARIDAGLLQARIEACFDCAQTCTACADVCETTGRLVSRQTQPDWSVVRAQLETCRSCSTECQKHGGLHEHCRVCAEVCVRGADACDRLVQVLPA
jgi:hypothetical protein